MGASWQESQSFMAGKSEKQDLGLRQGAKIMKNVKNFILQQRYVVAAKTQEAMTMMTDDSVIGGTVGIENDFEIFQSIYIIYILYI